MRRWLQPLLALGLVAACGGEGGSIVPTTTTTVAPSTTTTSTSTTTTTTSTTTTTLPPTTTTTRPAVPVHGWDGEGIRDASVVAETEYATTGLRDEVRLALRLIGVDVRDDSDVTLRAELDTVPRGATYGSLGTCYSGATVSGTITLEGPVGESSLQVTGNVPTPFAVMSISCRSIPADAPFAPAFAAVVMDSMVEFFGPASVPYLADLVSRPMEGAWTPWLILRREAVLVFGAMDSSEIPPAVQGDFLGAAIDGLERIVVSGGDDDIPPYLNALRQVLVSYSGEDFGFEDEADLAEWRSWLSSWRSANI